MDRLLGFVAQMKTDQAELLATVYAAWNDLLLDGRPADNAAITQEVYGWHESKRKFPPKRIAECIRWMRDNGYVPSGAGQRTQVVEKKVHARVPKRRTPRTP